MMDHETLYRLAHAAGMAAAERMTPTPMVVQEHASVGDDDSPVTRQWYVPSGVCGFAWVIVRPGTCSFARWVATHDPDGNRIRKQDQQSDKHHLRYTGNRPIGQRGYRGGIQIWVSYFGQSMERKQAYARAFAHALQINGISAYADSRMD